MPYPDDNDVYSYASRRRRHTDSDPDLNRITVPEMPHWHDYTTAVKLVDSDPATSERYYWSLYFKGDRVNGGLCDTADEAAHRAGIYKNEHHRILFLEKYFFDQESCRWLPRSYLNTPLCYYTVYGCRCP